MYKRKNGGCRMKLLYSNILPLGTEEDQETIMDCFNEQMKMADRVEIAVGYTSNASLAELDRLVNECNISKVCLNIGMYFIEGMPEGAYHTAIKINEKWQEAGIGEIRVVKAFKYHGKLFCFYKDGNPFSAIIGSANLGVIKLEASNRRQYEISAITTDEQEVAEIAEHIEKLKMPNCSENIALVKNMPLVREVNTALNGIELVTSVPKSNVEFYERCKAYVSFFLKLKVPKKDERHLDDGKHYTKSNINVCYAAPRSKRKARDWYETQLTVGADVYRMEGYPEKNKPYEIISGCLSREESSKLFALLTDINQLIDYMEEGLNYIQKKEKGRRHSRGLTLYVDSYTSSLSHSIMAKAKNVLDNRDIYDVLKKKIM